MARYTKNTATGTVGTSPVVTALEANGDRVRLWIYADSGNSGKVYVRWDGVDPTSTAYHIELTAGSGLLLDAAVSAQESWVVQQLPAVLVERVSTARE